MSDYTTDNIHLKKPPSGSTAWGDDVNENWEMIDSTITELKGAAPATLDTLEKLASAINDDSGFSTTVSNQLDQKATVGHGHQPASTAASGFLPQLPGDSTKLFNGAGNWTDIPDTTAQESYQRAMFKAMSYPNIVLNGELAVNQDEKGAVSVTTSPAYVTDGFMLQSNVANSFTAEVNKDSLVCSGYAGQLGFEVITSQSLSSDSIFTTAQRIEGTRLKTLRWGHSDAKPALLSFWVNSSIAGTFGGSLMHTSGSLSFPFTYTVAASDVGSWVMRHVVIDAETSGTWVETASRAAFIWFSLGTGSTYKANAGMWASGNYQSATGVDSHIEATAGTKLYITGIQMYPIDDVANPVIRPYQHKNYDEYLRDCQKWACWLERSGSAGQEGVQYDATTVVGTLYPKQPMPKLNRITIVNAPEVFDWVAKANYTSPGTLAVSRRSNCELAYEISVSGGAQGDAAGLMGYKIFVDGRL